MIKTFFITLAVAFAVQLDSAAAATSTVDGGAKPYLILGGLVAGLLFLSLGSVYLARGISRRQMAARSLQWPVTEGRILSAAVKTEMRSDSEGSDMKVYLPEASYSTSLPARPIRETSFGSGLNSLVMASWNGRKSILSAMSPALRCRYTMIPMIPRLQYWSRVSPAAYAI